MKRRPRAASGTKAETPSSSPPPFPSPPSRREWLLLAAVVLVGVVLRAAALAQSAVEHFDEGVYASNIYFGSPDYAWPMQRFYAPPLLAWLIEAGMLVGLPPNLAALLPGFLAGCGTIAAVWRLGRWWSERAGLAAAALVALSDFHVAYSAAALTDVLLGLWIVLAFEAIVRSLVAADLRWAAAAGAFTGLAWWTKYNGWLPLAIEAAGLVLLAAALRPAWPRVTGWLSCFAVTALVAAAVWAPYLFSLQQHGGYEPIAANHARYVVGLAGWPAAAARHIASQQGIETFFSALGVGLSLAVAFAAKGTRQGAIVAGGVVVAIGAFAWLGGSIAAVAVLAAFGLLAGACTAWQANDAEERLRRAIPVALLAAWWLGLFVMTPCYTPYPRLILPWLLASWMGTAIAWDALAAMVFDAPPADAPQRRFVKVILAAAGGAALVASLGGLALKQLSGDIRPAADRRGLMQIAQQIHVDGPTETQPSALPVTRAICVYGEPGLFFQLSAAGEPLVLVVDSVPSGPVVIEGRRLPTYLALGPHALADEGFLEQWAAASPQWELVEDYPHRPSRVVWYDLFDPLQPDAERQERLRRVQLYRLRR